MGVLRQRRPHFGRTGVFGENSWKPGVQVWGNDNDTARKHESYETITIGVDEGRSSWGLETSGLKNSTTTDRNGTFLGHFGCAWLEMNITL